MFYRMHLCLCLCICTYVCRQGKSFVNPFWMLDLRFSRLQLLKMWVVFDVTMHRLAISSRRLDGS